MDNFMFHQCLRDIDFVSRSIHLRVCLSKPKMWILHLHILSKLRSFGEARKKKRWGGGGGASIFSRRGAKIATAAMESSRDTVQFKWENAFRVYQTISRVNMFEWATIGKEFWLICVLKLITGTGGWAGAAVVKSVLWYKFTQETQWTPWGIWMGQRVVLNRSNQSEFKMQLNTVT